DRRQLGNLRRDGRRRWGRRGSGRRSRGCRRYCCSGRRGRRGPWTVPIPLHELLVCCGLTCRSHGCRSRGCRAGDGCRSLRCSVSSRLQLAEVFLNQWHHVRTFQFYVAVGRHHERVAFYELKLLSQQFHLRCRQMAAALFFLQQRGVRLQLPPAENPDVGEFGRLSGLQVFQQVLQVGLLQLLNDFLVVEDGLGFGMIDDLSEGRLRGQHVLKLCVRGDVLELLALGQG